MASATNARNSSVRCVAKRLLLRPDFTHCGSVPKLEKILILAHVAARVTASRSPHGAQRNAGAGGQLTPDFVSLHPAYR
jgi:hypothetical protein